VLPKIAIVGRPNVGKSSIMNMLAGRKVSITDDTPGTTRDRVTTPVILLGEDTEAPPVNAELIDTGGYGVYVGAGRQIDNAGKDLSLLTKDIESQIAKAVHHADLVIFVIDAQAGVTPMDETVAKLLREGGLGAIDEKGHTNAPAGNKVIVLANKVDGPKWESHAMEGAALGFGEPLVSSAKNNYRRRELVERLHEAVTQMLKKQKKSKKKMAAEPPAEMKLAIVGKRNSGKSTLVNTLAGEERVIVSEIAGTTRDAIDVRFQMGDKTFVAIDTAGLRRKRSFGERIEWWALERMQSAVDRCDVAAFMIDATEPISQVDEQVGHMLTESFKPCIIVVNKWDLVEGTPLPGGKRGEKVTIEHYEKYLRDELKGLWYAPIAFMSAKEGLNVQETINLAFEMMVQASSRTTTGKLNRLLRTIVEKKGPSSKIGSFAKVFYTSQIATNPPTIVLVVNKPELFTPNYQRFLLNRLREESPFGEVPIKLIIRDRKRHEAVITRRGEQGIMEGEGAPVNPAARHADAAGYFDEPIARGHMLREEGVEPEGAAEDEIAEFAQAMEVADAPRVRRPAPREPGKARPRAVEAAARSRKRRKGRTAN
jgi:GTP-binding protein